ncbi:BgTH12-03938 [Blumeria graminis f. sp. triticale]|uniref:BgTH12-03938 n=1 Tax=Blumeria graminis f. sp. triticale TaxID=1689686 RepID=A0A9W4D0Q6_BLUGR|nr:BgTH12-03938 [Blumeria graminis f. sp. triticale]
MALRQPNLQSFQKRSSTNLDQSHTQLVPQSLSDQQRRVADSQDQEWVLFDPSVTSTTDRNYTTSTARTLTFARSQISDIGSFVTEAQSHDDYNDHYSEEQTGDDEELDSLDSHLHEFKAEPSTYHGLRPEPGGTVLPTHDGLGSFRLDWTTMGDDVQEHLYTFEKFNPQRSKRRREGMERSTSFSNGQISHEDERLRRIESWRMEHSRVLVNEIKRESRQKNTNTADEAQFTNKVSAQENRAKASNTEFDSPGSDNETFWNRIKRRVIRDLIGINDDLLSIIFGESLPPDGDDPTISKPQGSVKREDSSWEYKLLERIGRELGILAGQISEHPPALNTNSRIQSRPLPYAGFIFLTDNKTVTPPSNQNFNEESSVTSRPPDPEFQPTIPARSQSSPNLFKSTASQSSTRTNKAPRTNIINKNDLAREDWERDLDLKAVFRYLRDRVTTKFLSPSTSRSSLVTTSEPILSIRTADTVTRAARVREHHPLVCGGISRENANPANINWKVSVPVSTVVSGISSSILGASSGPNQAYNTLKSGQDESRACDIDKAIQSGSSRHYWDWAGSVGSGNGVGGTGAMGSWGEV